MTDLPFPHPLESQSRYVRQRARREEKRKQEAAKQNIPDHLMDAFLKSKGVRTNEAPYRDELPPKGTVVIPQVPEGYIKKPETWRRVLLADAIQSLPTYEMSHLLIDTMIEKILFEGDREEVLRFCEALSNGDWTE